MKFIKDIFRKNPTLEKLIDSDYKDIKKLTELAGSLAGDIHEQTILLQKFQDKMQTVLVTWQEDIDKINLRLNVLEGKK